jgi:hypothetical protein
MTMLIRTTTPQPLQGAFLLAWRQTTGAPLFGHKTNHEILTAEPLMLDCSYDTRILERRLSRRTLSSLGLRRNARKNLISPRCSCGRSHRDNSFRATPQGFKPRPLGRSTESRYCELQEVCSPLPSAESNWPQEILDGEMETRSMVPTTEPCRIDFCPGIATNRGLLRGWSRCQGSIHCEV